jgi:hypothetical protein
MPFKEDAKEGAYCFIYAGSAIIYGMSRSYKVFDFGVNKKH